MQQAHSGYDADYQYLFDYGRRFTIKPGIDYWLVVKVESRYYSSAPEIRLAPEREHRLSADRHATAVVLCLGGLIFIACYNLFIFFTTRDKAFFLVRSLCAGLLLRLGLDLPLAGAPVSVPSTRAAPPVLHQPANIEHIVL